MEKAGRTAEQMAAAQVMELLVIPEGQCVSPLEQLKKGPVTVSGPAFTEALERYIRLRSLEFSRQNFSGLPAIQLRNLARYAGMASVKYIARMPQQRKLAVLTAFVKAQEIIALDNAVDVLDMLILDIIREAKKTGQKKLRTLKDLDRPHCYWRRHVHCCWMIIQMFQISGRLSSSAYPKTDWQNL